MSNKVNAATDMDTIHNQNYGVNNNVNNFNKGNGNLFDNHEHNNSLLENIS